MEFLRRILPILLALAVVGFFLFRRWRRNASLRRRLAEIEDKLRHHPPFSETAYVLNSDGTDVCPPLTVNATWSYQKPDGQTVGPFEKPWQSTAKGWKRSVSLKLRFTPQQEAQMKGKILLHNHTTLGLPFSESDVQFFLQKNLLEIRAITATHRYTMAQTDSGHVSWKQVEKDVQEWDKLPSVKTEKPSLHDLWVFIARKHRLSYRREAL